MSVLRKRFVGTPEGDGGTGKRKRGSNLTPLLLKFCWNRAHMVSYTDPVTLCPGLVLGLQKLLDIRMG